MFHRRKGTRSEKLPKGILCSENRRPECGSIRPLSYLLQGSGQVKRRLCCHFIEEYGNKTFGHAGQYNGYAVSVVHFVYLFIFNEHH